MWLSKGSSVGLGASVPQSPSPPCRQGSKGCAGSPRLWRCEVHTARELLCLALSHRLILCCTPPLCVKEPPIDPSVVFSHLVLLTGCGHTGCRGVRVVHRDSSHLLWRHLGLFAGGSPPWRECQGLQSSRDSDGSALGRADAQERGSWGGQAGQGRPQAPRREKD